ncbi:unnamed protein product [Malus baccata var. baccata]
MIGDPLGSSRVSSQKENSDGVIGVQSGQYRAMTELSPRCDTDNHVNDNANLDEIVENYYAPMWKYVKRLEKMENKGGGNTELECNYCQKTYKGSYSRVKFHLLKMSGNGIASCNKLTNETLAEMKKLVQECEYKMKSYAPKHVSLPNTGSFCYDLPEANLDPKKRKGTSGPLSKAFNKEARDQCDVEVARMFYTDASKEIGHENVVQVITDNAHVGKAAGLLIEAHHPHIFWTPCVVHTLNLALKSICSLKQTDVSYDDCNWISSIASDAWSINFFIMNHSMRLAMFNENCKLKLLSIAETRFSSTLVMLRRFKEVKEGLEQMVISLNWALYKEDDLVKAMTVKQKILDEYFWEKIDYILFFTAPIYEVIRMADTDKPCLHLVYEWWDAMIEKVKTVIYRNECKALHEKKKNSFLMQGIAFYWSDGLKVTHHFICYFFYFRYYSSEWLQEDPSCLAPHRDVELTTERKKKCFERYFSTEEIRRNICWIIKYKYFKLCIYVIFVSKLFSNNINVEYASFSMCLNDFGAIDSMNDRLHLEPVMWWIVHGASTPSLQSIALKLLGQLCSSSCCERNWSTYSFIHSLRRNKITPQRAEDLVFVHNNLRLLSRNSSTYKEGIPQLWDVGGDGFENLGEESVGMLEIANISLDEPSLETTLVTRGDIMNVEVE